MGLATPAANADEPMMDINTTPLIDVLLVLLVMLIITIPIQLHAVKLDLPVNTPTPPEVKPTVMRIDIDGSNTIAWNGEPVHDRSELRARLRSAAALETPPEVHVRPDQRAAYKTFAEVMVDVNQAGLHKMGVVGSEQFIDP